MGERKRSIKTGWRSCPAWRSYPSLRYIPYRSYISAEISAEILAPFAKLRRIYYLSQPTNLWIFQTRLAQQAPFLFDDGFIDVQYTYIPGGEIRGKYSNYMRTFNRLHSYTQTNIEIQYLPVTHIFWSVSICTPNFDHVLQ